MTSDLVQSLPCCVCWGLFPHLSAAPQSLQCPNVRLEPLQSLFCVRDEAPRLLASRKAEGGWVLGSGLPSGASILLRALGARLSPRGEGAPTRCWQGELPPSPGAAVQTSPGRPGLRVRAMRLLVVRARSLEGKLLLALLTLRVTRAAQASRGGPALLLRCLGERPPAGSWTRVPRGSVVAALLPTGLPLMPPATEDSAGL